MNSKRPVFLNLWQIRFPITAIASILHRVSGVFMFVALPLVLWIWGQSIYSLQTFHALQAVFSSLPMKLLVWIILTALVMHLLAGVRHLLMDIGIGETLKGGRFGASLVIGLTVIVSIMLGICIW